MSRSDYLTHWLINGQTNHVTATDELSRVFSALADPTRRDILARLGEGDATVGDLAAPYDVSLPAVSRHLKVLRAAGLITRTTRAQWRTNHLRTEPLREAGAWIDHLAAVWATRLDRLDNHLAAVQRRTRDEDTS
jgi:DNA-binding transcriptional ArsR family regulator